MRVLGIDPGLSRCGVGVVDRHGRRPRHVAHWVVTTPADAPVGRRLAEVDEAIAEALAWAEPDAVAVERLFLTVNARTAIGTAQAAGVALARAAHAGIDAAEYTPSEVKATVAGAGEASKEQVQVMVRAHLDMAEPPRPADAADALAVALTHLNRLAGGEPGAARARERAGGMSPRLERALAEAGPGAQVARPARARREGR